MMLAKLLICSILIFLARGTFITSQTCTTHTQCTNDGESPHTTQQDISPQQNTLIRGKAGPKGLKGEQGERGKTGRSGRDCNEAKINTKITQFESVVKYNFEALERVTAKNEADITNSQNQFEYLKTELNATKINLNQSNEQLQILRDNLNETKNELSSANDKITRLEVKMQMLLSASSTKVPTTPEPTTPEPTTPETTTPETTTPEPTTPETTTPETTTPETTTPETTTPVTTTPETILSDEDRAKACGTISNIADGAITASSIYYHNYDTRHSRLFSTSGDGGWCPYFDSYHGSWIQVDLGAVKQVRGIATQGRQDGNDYWVTTYSISFKTATSSSFQNIENQSGAKKIFQGNTDRNTVVVNDVDITARYIRIYPLTWPKLTVPVLRFDVLTC